MVANKSLQQTGCDWSVAKGNLGLKAYVTFEGFQLNASNWQDRLEAIEVLQLKGVETEGEDWRGSPAPHKPKICSYPLYLEKFLPL